MAGLRRIEADAGQGHRTHQQQGDAWAGDGAHGVVGSPVYIHTQSLSDLVMHLDPHLSIRGDIFPIKDKGHSGSRRLCGDSSELWHRSSTTTTLEHWNDPAGLARHPKFIQVFKNIQHQDPHKRFLLIALWR